MGHTGTMEEKHRKRPPLREAAAQIPNTAQPNEERTAISCELFGTEQTLKNRQNTIMTGGVRARVSCPITEYIQ
jgi:hypothetical protein